MKSKIREALKYLVVLPQLKTSHLKYIYAVFLYKLKREIRFPSSTVKLKGLKFFTRKNSMDIAHVSNLYEEETTKFLINLKPKFFIDVGAHIGRFSLLLAKEGAEVYAYEPGKDNYNQLRKNIEYNNLSSKITSIEKACSDKEGKTILYLVQQNEGQNTLEKTAGAKEENIVSDKLDNLISTNKKIVPEVIKIDVEGFELNVLKGAKQILSRYNPILIVEVLDKEKGLEIKNFLEPFGFFLNKILDDRNFIYIKK
jgi:FkbM family methyltransferase